MLRSLVTVNATVIAMADTRSSKSSTPIMTKPSWPCNLDFNQFDLRMSMFRPSDVSENLCLAHISWAHRCSQREPLIIAVGAYLLRGSYRECDVDLANQVRTTGSNISLIDDGYRRIHGVVDGVIGDLQILD